LEGYNPKSVRNCHDKKNIYKGGRRMVAKNIKRNQLGFGLFAILLFMTYILLMPKTHVYGAEDPEVGTSNEDVENMITIGKSLIGQTPYVYGGGHSNWNEQKELEKPTGLDNSSFVAWVLYRGMGIDMGLAPITSNFSNYFDTVTVGTLEGVKRGDLIMDDRHIEIYLGESGNKHYSLTATNSRNNISIQETNWGKGVSTKTIIRPSVEDAKKGLNGLTYNEDALIDGGIGTRAIGGEQIEMDNGGSGGGTIDGDKTSSITKDEDDSDDEESEGDTEGDTETNTDKKTDPSSAEELFAWLNPIVDFTGSSNTHAKSSVKDKQIDGVNKGLKGHKQSIFKGIFGGL